MLRATGYLLTVILIAPPVHSQNADDGFWQSVRKDSAEEVGLYLQQFPRGRYADEAKRQLESLREQVRLKAEVERLKAEKSALVEQQRLNAGTIGADNKKSESMTPTTQYFRVKKDTFDAIGLAALKDSSSPLSIRSVYFDQSSISIRGDSRPLVESHAKFLVAHPEMKMLIVGHAEEHSGREYNLAFGHRRAETIMVELISLGVREENIEAVSMGKEKPSCLDVTEICQAQMRRVDFLYSGEF